MITFGPGFTIAGDLGPPTALGALGGIAWEMVLRRRRKNTAKRIAMAAARGAGAGAALGVAMAAVGVDVSDMLPPVLVDMWDTAAAPIGGLLPQQR